MKTVTVENVVFGQGRPKILVPLVGIREPEILEAAAQAKELNCDVIEWRIDFYELSKSPKKLLIFL